VKEIHFITPTLILPHRGGGKVGYSPTAGGGGFYDFPIKGEENILFFIFWEATPPTKKQKIEI